MITINPLGGLCNRMRALDSALALAAATGQSLHLHWEMSEELNAGFHDLFVPVPEISGLTEFRVSGRSTQLLRLGREFSARLRGIRVFTQETVVAHVAVPDFWRQQAVRGDLHIRTHSRFFKGAEGYPALQPAAAIKAVIEPYQARLGRSVAVHIRRTDNAQSLANSPLSAFISLMQEIQERDASANFFVASDDPAVLDALQQRFGSAVWWHEKQAYDRNEAAAIRDAVVDLFCLSACSQLIGSYWSSFTDTAAELGRIPCTIARA